MGVVRIVRRLRIGYAHRGAAAVVARLGTTPARAKVEIRDADDSSASEQHYSIEHSTIVCRGAVSQRLAARL